MVLVLGSQAVCVPGVTAKMMHPVHIAFEDEAIRRSSPTSKLQAYMNGVHVFDASEYMNDAFQSHDALLDMRHFRYLGLLLHCNKYASWGRALMEYGVAPRDQQWIMSSCSALMEKMVMRKSYGYPYGKWLEF